MLTLTLRALVVIGLIAVPTQLRAQTVLKRIVADGEATAAAVPDRLPVSAVDANGRLTGFDIDVSRELAKRLGYPVTFVTPGWEVILSGDWGSRFDFCACSITPTKERTAQLRFPAAYRFDAAVLVVRDDNRQIDTVGQASGKRVGVKGDTTFQRYLQKDLVIFARAPVTFRVDDAKIVTFPSKEEALDAVVRREVDASITALVTARGAIEAGAPLRIVPGFLFFEPVAVAIAKGDDAMAASVANAVKMMHEDGTLTKLSLTWFGIDLTRVLE